MKGLNPCPYCGGEVEVVRLNRKRMADPPMYRIECRKCHALVARGTGFPDESKAKAKERIQQYEDEMRRYLYGE